MNWRKRSKGRRPKEGAGGRVDGALKAFMVAAGRRKLLTKEEELELGRRSRAGDLEARKLLVESNLRLVVYLTRRMVGTPGARWEDILHEGVVGLCVAAEKFDPSRGVRFASYATSWINAKTFFLVMKHCNGWLGGSQATMTKKRKAGTGEVPVVLCPDFAAPDGEKFDRMELVADDATGADAVVDEVERRAAVFTAVNQVAKTPLEIAVASRRILVDQEDRDTFQTIGDEFGVSRERVRQIEVRVLGRATALLKQRADEETARTGEGGEA